MGDPLEMMREAYAQGIERWSELVGEIVGSDDFAAASGQLLALYAQQQQSARAASRAMAEAMQVPTTEDIAAVSRLVINVERKLDELSDQSAEIAIRLGAIETRLADLIGELARRPEPAPAQPVAAKPAPPKVVPPQAAPATPPATLTAAKPVAAKPVAAKTVVADEPTAPKPARVRRPPKA